MPDERFSILGIRVSATTYERAVAQIIAAAESGARLSVTALAVHGLMTGVLDPQFRFRLNQFDLVTPDGQPVRWALRFLHGVRLPDRVYGPSLTLRLCEVAAQRGIGVYFYGSEANTLEALQTKLQARFPALRICAEPSRFRRLTALEQEQLAERIDASGARIVFVGLGCPRQEIWAYEYRDRLKMPVIAVGAAFDFISEKKSQAPGWMQARGLEWLFRLGNEPGRLWRRYLLLNPYYLLLIAAQKLRLRRFDTAGTPVEEACRYG